MNRLTCEMCGSTEMLKQDGVFVCQTCGCKYTVEEAKKMMIDGVVEVTGTVKVDNTDKTKNMMINAERALQDGKYSQAQQLCASILLEEPNNAFAILYEGLAIGWQGNLVRYYYDKTSDATIRAIRVAKKSDDKDYMNSIVEQALMLNNSLVQAICNLAIQTTNEYSDRAQAEMTRLSKSGVDPRWAIDESNRIVDRAKKELDKAMAIVDQTSYLYVLALEEIANLIYDKYEIFQSEIIVGVKDSAQEIKNSKGNKSTPVAQRVINKINSIEDKKRQDAQRKRDERIKEYWNNHQDEKRALEKELRELNDEKCKLGGIVNSVNNSIATIRDEKSKKLKIEEEKKEILSKIEELKGQKSKLGIFKGKEKAKLDEMIATLNSQLSDTEKRIAEEKQKRDSECETKIHALNREKQPNEQRLSVIETRIKQINLELTKDR